MLSIQPTTVELVGDGKLVPKAKGGYLFSAFCMDLAERRKTYIRMVVFDDELARYLNENTSNGSRIQIAGVELKSNVYTPKSGLLQKKKKKRNSFEIVVEQATVLPKE